MEFEIPSLPYAKNALEPHIGARTVDIHYEKHHKGYVSKLKDAIAGKPLAEQSLEFIISAADDAHVFNLAAQVWNHNFYWSSLAPDGGGRPSGALAEAIDRDFGSLEKLRRDLAEAANAQFGSGWAWLVANRQGRLCVMSSSNAENPVRSGVRPFLTIDVWEHAYYLDYQNERAKYVEAVVEGLLNWSFVEKNFGS
jgi:Fe-Mn family superoxide dismutase